MTKKVCIVCDNIIDLKEMVDYDVFATFFKYDQGGDIIGNYDKYTTVHFHEKCFTKFKKEKEKKDLYFTQEVGYNRLVIKTL